MEQELLRAIREAASRNKDAIAFLEAGTYRVECIKSVRGLLQACAENRTMTYYWMLFQRDLLKRRGLVMSIEQLVEHEVSLFNATDVLAGLISVDVPLNNMFAQAVALTYRFRMEKDKTGLIPEFRGLYDCFEKSPQHEMLALNILYFVVDVMTEGTKHLSVAQNKELRTKFADHCLPDYFRRCLRVLRKLDHVMAERVLELIVNIFMFRAEKPIAEFTAFKATQKWSDFYTVEAATDIVGVLTEFVKSRNETVCFKAMKAFVCYCSVPGDRDWSSGRFGRYIEFWLRNVSAVIEFLEQSVNYNASSLFLVKFASMAQLGAFLKEEKLSVRFFDAAVAISRAAIGTDDVENVLHFWEMVGKIEQVPDKIKGMAFGVFQSYVEHLVSNESYFQELCEDAECYSEEFEKLWKMAAIVIPEACQIVCQILQRVISFENKAVVLTLIATLYKTHIPIMPCEVQKEKVIVLPIFMTAMDTFQPGVFSGVPMAERIYIHCARTMIEKLVKGRDRNVHILLSSMESDRLQYYNYWVNRLLDHLAFFRGEPDVCIDILSCLSEMMDALALKDLAKSSERLNQLVRREIDISFDLIDVKTRKRILVMLSSIYARGVGVDEEDTGWPLLLESLDREFIAVATSEDAYCVFCKLNGMLVGATTPKAKMIILKWILSKHVPNIVNAIKSARGDRNIIGMIVSGWTRLCSMKKGDFEGSASGIELYRASVLVLEAILELRDLEDRDWLVLKILRPSFLGRYANFGIMKLYNDNALEKTGRMLFAVLASWRSEQIQKHESCMIDCISALNDICAEPIFSVGFEVVCGRLMQGLLSRSYPVWRSVCECLTGLMTSAKRLNVRLFRFFQHFIVIIDGLITLPVQLSMDEKEMRCSISKCMFHMINAETSAVEKFFGEIIGTYEQRYRDQVNEIFKALIEAAVKYPEFKREFVREVEGFQIAMQPYVINVSRIPAFAPIFKMKAHDNKK